MSIEKEIWSYLDRDIQTQTEDELWALMDELVLQEALGNIEVDYSVMLYDCLVDALELIYIHVIYV